MFNLSLFRVRRAPCALKQRGYAGLMIYLILVSQAEASFHLWRINEIYSNADGSVQFIEFVTSFGGQQFLSGHALASSDAAGSSTQNFTFPNDLPGDTANRSFLVATPGFANLPGGITPDYTIPAGFLFTAGGRLNYAGVDLVTYAPLPTDGTNSISRTGAKAVNSPSNFAGQTGSLKSAVNSPPSVAITNPPNGRILTAPASFAVEASATDSDGISKVEFFQDGTLIATDTNAPYSQAVAGLSAKTYTFAAVATDGLGVRATNSISITVQAPPTVTIASPTNGAAFLAPATLTVEATASDTVTNASLALSSSTSSNSFGPDAGPPFGIPEHIFFTLTNLAAGTYQVSVIGTDNLGVKATNSITIAVYAQPVLSSPVRGPSGKFRFDITSKTGQPIVIQASGDLSAWQNLTATNAPSDKFTFMDESAPNVNLRFYRTHTP
ncbi:MAG: hypothetical protein DME26_07100 [Verrucomicrobia bacterium]|nr:MAG: hypothetical protein DME26_07100 [Verrucomicrobiota bacterium]